MAYLDKITIEMVHTNIVRHSLEDKEMGRKTISEWNKRGNPNISRLILYLRDYIHAIFCGTLRRLFFRIQFGNSIEFDVKTIHKGLPW